MQKRIPVILLLGFLSFLPSWVQSQPDKILERLLGPVVEAGDLRILQLEMTPDPMREGEWVGFQAVVSNLSRHPGTRYPFQGSDHCFTVMVDVERTPYRLDAAKEFCAKPLGWTLRP